MITTVNYDSDDATTGEKIGKRKLKKGEWVVVCYDGRNYPGEVTKDETAQGVVVNVMRPAFPNKWKWPAQKDELLYIRNQIVCIIKPPVPVDARNSFIFDEHF